MPPPLPVTTKYPRRGGEGGECLWNARPSITGSRAAWIFCPPCSFSLSAATRTTIFTALELRRHSSIRCVSLKISKVIPSERSPFCPETFTDFLIYNNTRTEWCQIISYFILPHLLVIWAKGISETRGSNFENYYRISCNWNPHEAIRVPRNQNHSFDSPMARVTLLCKYQYHIDWWITAGEAKPQKYEFKIDLLRSDRFDDNGGCKSGLTWQQHSTCCWRWWRGCLQPARCSWRHPFYCLMRILVKVNGDEFDDCQVFKSESGSCTPTNIKV